MCPTDASAITICSQGTCLFQCTGGTTQCGTALAPFCTDTTTDNLNCGAAPLPSWRATLAAWLLARGTHTCKHCAVERQSGTSSMPPALIPPQTLQCCTHETLNMSLSACRILRLCVPELLLVCPEHLHQYQFRQEAAQSGPRQPRSPSWPCRA